MKRRTLSRGMGRKSRLGAIQRRGLLAESLEPRIVLSGFGSHGHGRHFETHYVKGTPVDFTWDPVEASGDSGGSGSGSGGAASGSWQTLASGMPVLNSHPSAAVQLFLDFDGHFEAVWGTYTNLTTPVFDLDSDPTTFSTTEQERIVEIWARVSEDFAPFDINVTTIEPAELVEGAPDNAANGKAHRIAIGDTWGSTAGGTAYINSFTNSITNVAYVFSPQASAQWLAKTASHEAGHAFGLYHQSLYDTAGNKLEEYHPGDGYWAPIMGGANPVVATWANGPDSSGSTNVVDEFAILSRAENVFGVRGDDHGDTIATATPLSGDGNTWSGNGVVEDNTDADVFGFTVTTADVYRTSIDVAALGPDLNSVLEVRDSGGALVAAADSPYSLESSLYASLTPGDYFVTATKTSDYSWLGQYTVNVTRGAAGPGPAVGEVLTAASSDGSGHRVRAIFTHPIDAASLTPADVIVTGPDQTTATVTSVDPVAGSQGYEFDIVLSPQTAPAVYSLTIGPDVQDPFGNLMNQDDDDTNGESAEDQFAGQFQIADSITGWTFEIESGLTFQGSDMGIGPDGFLYVVGNFAGKVDFDPGPGETWLSSLGGADGDGYVAKYTRDRQLLWARRFGGEGNERGRSLDVDAAGNVYIGGQFASTSADFGGATLQAFLWAHGFGSTDNENVTSVRVADNDDVFLSGVFKATVDFDPGPSTTAVTSAGGSDGFVSKFDAAGNFQSVWTFGGPGTDAHPYVDLDDNGNVYVAARFSDTIQLGQGISLTSAGSWDLFVAKLNSSSTPLWARQISGTGLDSQQRLTVNSAGDIFVLGRFASGIDLGPGAPILTGTNDAFVMRLDTDNNFQWAAHFDSTDLLNPRDIELDNQGNPIVLSVFSGTVDLDPGAGTSLVSAINNDTLLLSLDAANGDFRWAHQFGGPGETETDGIDVDEAGSIYTKGQFTDQVISPSGDVVIASVFAKSAFVSRLDTAPMVSVVPTDNHLTTEGGGQAQFGLVLSLPPTATVTVTVASSDLGEGTVDVTNLVFTSADWDQPQIVTVTGVDDATLDGDVLYQIQLTSSDANFAAPDVTFINADDEFAPETKFADSFENGQWNGLWVEDSQNDWFTSTQRSTVGNYSAEVDGNAGNATLTVATPIDMSAYGSADLTFSWYIESGFDSGEYLALDFKDNTGAWNEILRLAGNVDQENAWHAEQVALASAYLHSSFEFRYRAQVSSSKEDANVDNVQLVATSLSGPPNNAPVAGNDAYNATEDVTLVVNTASGVLANDTDADNDPLVAVLVNGPANGSLNLDSTGSFIYTPASNFNGVDSFTYKANDGRDDSNTATVTITVGAVNDAPVASTDSYSADPDATLVVPAASGVLENDTDADGDPLAAVVDTVPASGVLSLAGDGSFTYTPNAGFTGDDSFSYHATDGTANSASTTVTINVSSNSVVFSDSFEVGEWNGNWVEDSQNDWFRSTQRSTDGSYSAEVDGRASDASLTVATSIDLSGYGSATLEFSWYIENGFDSGEYLALDFSSNGGGSWTEIRQLKGNVDQENAWHDVTEQISSSYLVSDFKFRFRGTASRSNEDANVDNVRVTAGQSLVGSTVGSGLRNEGLTMADATAMAYWAESLSGSGGAVEYELRVADLPGNLLGSTHGRTITIDADGAGVGWFIDATPWESSEFLNPAGIGPRYDLLTALAHELGHLQGRDHTDAGLMAATLEPGVRRLPPAIDQTFTLWGSLPTGVSAVRPVPKISHPEFVSNEHAMEARRIDHAIGALVDDALWMSDRKPLEDGESDVLDLISDLDDLVTALSRS